MERYEFRRWLESCPLHPHRLLMPSTIKTYVADVARVEKYYDHVEIMYVKDRFAGFLKDPSKVPTTPGALSDYKTAIRHYLEFLDYRMRKRLC